MAKKQTKATPTKAKESKPAKPAKSKETPEVATTTPAYDAKRDYKGR